MNIKNTSLGSIGAGIAMGAIVSLASINPVHAGSFNRDIINSQGDTVGGLSFTWDDSLVVDNMLTKFTSLTSFYLTDYGTTSYDLDFAENADFQKFEYNVATDNLEMWAFNSADTPTGSYGFMIKPEENLKSGTYGMGMYGDKSLDLEPVSFVTVSVPENSLTTALLIIGGLIFLRPSKMFES